MWTEINPLVEGQVLITVFNSIYFILFWLMQWTFFITNGHQVSWKKSTCNTTVWTHERMLLWLIIESLYRR